MDPHAAELLEQTKADARMGRISEPLAISTINTQEVAIASRFSVEQGVKSDGSRKIRAVDDESAAGINPACAPRERLRLDGLDKLIALVRYFVVGIGCIPAMFKADIDAAYRRIPIRPSHRWAAFVAFGTDEAIIIAQHFCMMFGAVAAVHAWDRLGSLLTVITRRVLHIPVLRYVDDFFSADRPKCAAHAKDIFARLVRAVLGNSAIAAHKLEHGPSLVVLGISVAFNGTNFKLRPMAEKIDKWSRRIDSILRTGYLTCGEAGKLAGALSWASQHCFHRLGRAMLRPLFAHAHSHRAKVSQSMRLALEWWLEVLTLDLEEVQSWATEVYPPVHLFADARGSPPRLAAVVLVDGRSCYTDWAPPSELLEFFRNRSDNQIMGLELLAIALGLSTFSALIRGRRVCVWSDNAGSEAATRKGSAREWDHACIVHCIWKKAVVLRCALFIQRVPTDENIADLPSREEYALLRAIGAQCVPPRMDTEFWHPWTWEALSLMHD